MADVIPAPVDPVEELLSIDQVARRLKVSPDTINRWCRTGEFYRPMYVGKLPRWRVRDLNRWVEERAARIHDIEKTAFLAAQRATRHRKMEGNNDDEGGK